MSESGTLKEIMLACCRGTSRLFRNQVGKYELKDGRWLASGLCVGSSDLIGWKSIIVTPEMVGRKLAVFAAVETKAIKGRASEAQKHFIETVQAAGGIAGVARSPEQAVALLETLPANRAQQS